MRLILGHRIPRHHFALAGVAGLSGSVIASGVLALSFALSPSAQATITLTNGSFEQINTQYSSALGGLYSPTGWTNLTPLQINASSALTGVEGTDATFMTGNRFLRLASDNPSSSAQGATTQLLGTMLTGETYTFQADIFGGSSVNANYSVTGSFVSQGAINPSFTYSSLTVSTVGTGTSSLNAFGFSYTATAADNGNPLYILLQAGASGAGAAQRGGIDNARVTVSNTTAPEPGSLALLIPGISTLGLAARKRWKRRK